MAQERRSRPRTTRSTPPGSWLGAVGAKRRLSFLHLGLRLRRSLGAADGGPLQLDAVRVVQQAIADRVGLVGIPDDAVPVLDRRLAGDEGRASLAAILGHP